MQALPQENVVGKTVPAIEIFPDGTGPKWRQRQQLRILNIPEKEVSNTAFCSSRVLIGKKRIKPLDHMLR